MVQTAGVPSQPVSLAGILKAMVSPEPSAWAWVSAARNEQWLAVQGCPSSRVVVTVRVFAAKTEPGDGTSSPAVTRIAAAREGKVPARNIEALLGAIKRQVDGASKPELLYLVK